MHRKLRLRKREDFNVVYRYGRSFANSQFVVYWRKRSKSTFRMGVSASSKLGGAVVRNRLRRMVKEIVRLNSTKLHEDMDLILIVRKPALSLPYKQMESSILHVLRKAGLLKGSVPSPSAVTSSAARGNRTGNRNGKQGK
ncbi:ribonuclease P protein component [Cohnella lupini]|uniref:Ribonuclease P protein component n=1 Tax=Cohnella lupini TaxID=1294267 RepID=A0A3D9HUY8_9BACL|nr:ribonuclease P protein component [Cohnella lupini]RED52696.1 ribonuclease P protein component [Cohnella lupini]